MSDRRAHRGAHPKDEVLFDASAEVVLAVATSELSWLLSRGYNSHSALKLVGDRHSLVVRQREAVMRCSCGDGALIHRVSKERSLGPGETVWIDGLNVLLTVEVALGGGVVLLARDGCARDVASVHGTYRRVGETLPAIEHLGTVLWEAGVRSVRVVLDSPVSNTRKLAGTFRQSWAERLDVDVLLETNADRVLVESGGLVASADAGVLDRCGSWVNLARRAVERVPGAWTLNLGAPAVAGGEGAPRNQ